MPRLSRKYLESSYIHIIVQGINREYIFYDEECILKFKELLKEKLVNSDIEILAYCIMNNHAHILTYSEEAKNISKFMQKVNTSYAKYYNKKANRVGYVFRDRYYAQAITNETQLFNCVAYIHNNPVKANIANKMSEYLYSSYNEYLKNREIITENSIKLLLGSSQDYINEFNKLHNIVIQDYIYDVDFKDIEEIIKEYEKLYNCDISTIIKDKKIFQKILKKIRKETKLSIVELSNFFNVSKSTISNYVKSD